MSAPFEKFKVWWQNYSSTQRLFCVMVQLEGRDLDGKGQRDFIESAIRDKLQRERETPHES